MFNTITNTAIDAVQTGKKQVVTTFVRHESLANTINKFVDAETAYTKSLFDNTVSTLTDFYTLFSSKDFVKEVTEFYTPTLVKSEKKTK